MPLSLQHHFDRRIVGRPEVACRLVLAVPTHLQNPVRRNRPQVVGATGVVLIHPDPNRGSLQRCARTPRELGDPARREPAPPRPRMPAADCKKNRTPTVRESVLVDYLPALLSLSHLCTVIHKSISRVPYSGS